MQRDGGPGGAGDEGAALQKVPAGEFILDAFHGFDPLFLRYGAQVNDDVIDFLIAHVSHGGRAAETEHAGIGTAVFDGFSDKAIGNFVKETCCANGSACTTGDITVTVYAVTGRADIV